MFSYDYVRVFDGNTSEEPYLLKEVSGEYSHSYSVFPSNVSSSSNRLLVTFTSDEWYGDRGFDAKIHVEPLMNVYLSANACSVTNPCSENQGHCQSDDECKGYLRCGQNNCPAELGYHITDRCCYDYCSQWLDIENGVLTSPWYPNQYPRSFRCRTLITVGITVAGPRTITLEFLQFKVSKLVYVIYLTVNNQPSNKLFLDFFSC